MGLVINARRLYRKGMQGGGKFEVPRLHREGEAVFRSVVGFGVERARTRRNQ